jgi:SAM-dependent methyltransferase
MERPDWAPEGIDTERPSAARIYDYALGGLHNFAVDRETARHMFAAMPDLPLLMQANRAFLRRAVQFLVGAGIRQFLDLGSGIPTVGNVHEVARQLAPDTKVMYVDIDPVAVAHARAVLAGIEGAGVIQEDLRRPDHILAHQDVRALLDFDQPIGLLIVSVLQFFPDSDDPAGIVARFRDALAPGSYVVISQVTDDARAEEASRTAQAFSSRAPDHFHFTTRAAFERLFGGWELVPPGIVWLPEWHPDSPADVDEHPEHSMLYAGAGRKM